MTPAKMTATWRSASNSANTDFGIFCNPESRRVEGFSIALGRRLRQRPKLVPWQWVLDGGDWEKRLEASPRFLRIESPGKNWNVERLLLMTGADVDDVEANCGWRRMSARELAALENDSGRVLPMRQWFLGWSCTLKKLEAWAQSRGFESRWLCPPADVLCTFDKHACQLRLEAAEIPVPPALGIPRHFDELWEFMRASGRKRVFLKPCHGSSASGVVALETNGTEIQAFSTLEVVEVRAGARLYNRRRIQTWRGSSAVRRLVDSVCGERCLAQVWIPKAGICGCPFDLRVVVIGRRARHVMVRLGRGPMTNSQLLGGKGDVETLRRKMGASAWSRMLSMCEEAMAKCFPDSLYAGFDVLIEPDFRTAWIHEVNAFGDLLPRTLHEGCDTYGWEIEAALERMPGQVSCCGT